MILVPKVTLLSPDENWKKKKCYRKFLVRTSFAASHNALDIHSASEKTVCLW